MSKNTSEPYFLSFYSLWSQKGYGWSTAVHKWVMKMMHLECSFHSLRHSRQPWSWDDAGSLDTLAQCIGMRVISVQFHEDSWVCKIRHLPCPSSSSQADQVDDLGRSQCPSRWLSDKGIDTKSTPGTALKTFNSVKILKHLYLAFMVSTSEHLFMDWISGAGSVSGSCLRIPGATRS